MRTSAAHGLPLAARLPPLAPRHLRLASLLTLVVLAASACHKTAEVPVYVVTPETFVRRVTAEGNLKAVKSTPISSPSQAQAPLQIAWIADDGAMLHKDDLIVRFDATSFSNALVQAHSSRGTADNKLQHSTIDSTTTKTNLQRDAKQAEEELTAAKHFRSDDAEIFSRYQQIESQLDEALAGEKRNHAHKVLDVREQLSKADREIIGIEAKKADLDVANAEKGLQSLEVRAPHDGILVLQRDWRGDVPRVGTTKWSGSPIGEIPDLSAMNAEVFVLEADAAGLNLGQKAMITLEAVPGKKFSGTIVGVDKLARPRLRGVPVQYFGVTVKLDKTEPKVMKPGARVLAQLELENRSNAISIPRQAVFDKRGQKIVYVRRGNRFVPSAVTVATSSPGRVVVTKGVSKGDALALTDPTDVKS
jgi:multidrug resistance efflux pump